MKLLIVLSIFGSINLVAADINDVNQGNTQHNIKLPSSYIAVDEVVVESSLYIKPKQQRPQLRRIRRSVLSNVNILKSLVEHIRVKRQFERYGQSQPTSNAAVYQNNNNFYSFGNSAANVQPFNAQGQLGSFGGSTAVSQTQSLDTNSYGTQNSVAASLGMRFNLPNGPSVHFAASNNFSNDADPKANSRGSAVSVNRN